LSFDDNTFDLIISQGVLEHIFDIKRALSELFRITRSSGACIIMVPFHRDSLKSGMLAREKEDGQIEQIVNPPEMHSDPVGEGGILTYWHHGWEFIQIMKEAGYQNVNVHFYNNVYKGYFGIQTIITGEKNKN
jgi:ubiquinone/menaquinone biosynthesis C-methylase UbiE